MVILWEYYGDIMGILYCMRHLLKLDLSTFGCTLLLKRDFRPCSLILRHIISLNCFNKNLQHHCI